MDISFSDESNLWKHDDENFTDEDSEPYRSSCMRIGPFLIIQKVIEEYKLLDMLKEYFYEEEARLFLDLAAYSIVEESNERQYYSTYVYNHPLFTEDMRLYRNTVISEFLTNIEDSQWTGFLDDWNERRKHQEKIYISYNANDKNWEAGETELTESEYPEEDEREPLYDCSIAYDTENKVPLFYETSPGAACSNSRIRYMLKKAGEYGYHNVGFLLDRGYVSKENIRFMDENDCDFLIMVNGMDSFVSSLVEEVKGTFENKRSCSIRKHKVHGMTIKRHLDGFGEGERYFHIYYSEQEAFKQRDPLEVQLDSIERFLAWPKDYAVTDAEGYREYFQNEGVLSDLRAKKKEIERNLSFCGYFVIVTSEKMTARTAIELYKGRDASENVFRGDKCYLWDPALEDGLGFYYGEVPGKLFIEFVALIIRSRIYTLLKESGTPDEELAYMSIPEVMRELERIEMLKDEDGVYRLASEVTQTQATILSAFQMDIGSVKRKADELSTVMAEWGV